MPYRDAGGAYADQVVVPDASVLRLPDDVDFPAGSTFVMNALTARLVLDDLGLSAGQTLAVTGAAGAFGGYVVQMAKADGLRVVADAAEKDEELVRSLGADDVVRRGDDVAAHIRAEVPDGVDGLVDGAVQAELVLPAVKDGGVIGSVRGWSGRAGARHHRQAHARLRLGDGARRPAEAVSSSSSPTASTRCASPRCCPPSGPSRRTASSRPAACAAGSCSTSADP